MDEQDKLNQELESQQPAEAQQQEQVVVQQVVVQQVAQPTTASAAEKEALFSASKSVAMLIMAIALTVNMLVGVILDGISLQIISLVGKVLDLLIVIGVWITWANGRKQKLSAAGIKLIKAPFIIKFVFTAIGFGLGIYGMVTNLIALALGVINFVLTIIVFVNIKNALEIAGNITADKSVADKKLGKKGAILIIISSVIALVKGIFSAGSWQGILYMILRYISADLADMIGDTVVLYTIISSVFAVLASVSVAVVLIVFNKKLNAAHKPQEVTEEVAQEAQAQ